MELIDNEEPKYTVPRRKFYERDSADSDDASNSPFPFLKQTRNLMKLNTTDHSSTLERIEKEFEQSNSVSLQDEENHRPPTYESSE